MDKKAVYKKYFKRWKNLLREAIFFVIVLIVLETIFMIYQKIDASTYFFHIIFTLPLGCFLASFNSLFSGKVNAILSTIEVGLSAVWLCTQVVYYHVFLVYMEFTKITMAGDVAGAFGGETVQAIIDCIPKILLVAAIVVAFSLLIFRTVTTKAKRRAPVLCFAGILISIVLHWLCVGCVALNPGAIKTYNTVPRVLDNNVETFGYFTSLRLELKDLMFGSKKSTEHGFDTEPGILNPVNTDETEDTDPGTDTSGRPIEKKKTNNVLNIDLDKVIANETDENLREIYRYVASQSGTYVNDYTGCFEGYNLITICAESFCDAFIDEKLTPYLYKMRNNGFVFNNYYGMYKSITTNGEFAFTSGLIPLSQGNVDDLKNNSTFLASADKYMPYFLGNVFDGLGATTCAYHGHSSSYYKRGLCYANMGYKTLRFTDCSIIDGKTDKSDKLELGKYMPSPDWDLAKQTLDDYLSVKDENGNVKQFTAHYMTYSGHHPYYDIYDKSAKGLNPQSWFLREDSFKNNPDNVIDSLPYNEVVKTYIACNMQVEYMVKEIYERLEAAGCLDNTVIVLTNDHYPYGLTDANYKNLVGKSVNTDFGIYKNVFICYNAAMETPVVVDTPCCTVDILPTLLNMFGVEYDSRLLAGVDVLDSKSFHIAMLYNKNFITDKVMYKESNGKTTYIVNEDEISDGYVDACISYVKNKFEISLRIIETDFYKSFYENLEKYPK